MRKIIFLLVLVMLGSCAQFKNNLDVVENAVDLITAIYQKIDNVIVKVNEVKVETCEVEKRNLDNNKIIYRILFKLSSNSVEKINDYLNKNDLKVCPLVYTNGKAYYKIDEPDISYCNKSLVPGGKIVMSDETERDYKTSMSKNDFFLGFYFVKSSLMSSESSQVKIESSNLLVSLNNCKVL